MQRRLQERKPITRRLVYTAIVIVAAVAISWWGARRETQRYDAIRSRIMTLCESLSSDALITWQYDWASAAVARPVMARIQSLAMSIPDGALDALRVEVAPEGLAPFERGDATHQAVVYVYDEPRLGLLLEVGDDPQRVLIVGYWEPTNQ